MARRPGLSLTEVLVALFIMAIGVMGVLTMFPLGAVQMGQAIKDERCAECAGQADAYMRWYWRNYIMNDPTGSDPIWQALNNGSPTCPTDGKPSPPVFVDPMGDVSRAANNAGVVGDTGSTTTIARRSVKPVTQYHSTPGTAEQTFALRTCTLLDGFSYAEDGTIQPNTAGNLERENRYNWAWVLQRPVNATSSQYAVNMTVVVFDRRVHMYSPSASEVGLKPTNPSGTPLASNGFVTGGSSFVVSGALPEGLQKGSWVADISTVNGTQLCDFYRVVSATKNGTDNNLEFQTLVRTPITGSTPARPVSNPPVQEGMYFGGVAEVFERTPLP